MSQFLPTLPYIERDRGREWGEGGGKMYKYISILLVLFLWRLLTHTPCNPAPHLNFSPQDLPGCLVGPDGSHSALLPLPAIGYITTANETWVMGWVPPGTGSLAWFHAFRLSPTSLAAAWCYERAQGLVHRGRQGQSPSQHRFRKEASGKTLQELSKSLVNLGSA